LGVPIAAKCRVDDGQVSLSLYGRQADRPAGERLSEGELDPTIRVERSAVAPSRIAQKVGLRSSADLHRDGEGARTGERPTGRGEQRIESRCGSDGTSEGTQQTWGRRGRARERWTLGHTRLTPRRSDCGWGSFFGCRSLARVRGGLRERPTRDLGTPAAHSAAPSLWRTAAEPLLLSPSEVGGDPSRLRARPGVERPPGGAEVRRSQRTPDVENARRATVNIIVVGRHASASILASSQRRPDRSMRRRADRRRREPMGLCRAPTEAPDPDGRQVTEAR
jgi:hypothetical protein